MLPSGDLWVLLLSDKDSACKAPQFKEAPRSNHPVSEGLMTLAEDKRTEANLLIGLSQYALQHHRDVS